MGQYLINIFIAFDRMVNAMITGSPDETLSSVAYRKHRDGARWGFMQSVINVLFFSTDHCRLAYIHDRERTLAP